jgi:tetratricopeptide (TPR) repeat protein
MRSDARLPITNYQSLIKEYPTMKRKKYIPAVVIFACVITPLTSAASAPVGRQTGSVRVWEEPLTLPTYRVNPPDSDPMFYTHESYQGAEKRIYPYPFLDGVTNVREQRTYKALHLENEYVRLTILPELGGRLFSALDKTDNYEMFYHQHVIKPALIGMLGAWISGGIEWCVFHHHRNTTFMPVDYTLAANPDGSKTIWFGETERRHRMKWLIGVTLYPGKSYIEVTTKLFNRTAVPNSILYWANAAVHVNNDYQVIFPPSVRVATYHAKNDFTHWPISHETYRGVDYRGVDLSWWKNHPEPISFFAWNLQEDFSGGYDHGRDAGIVHVGNHHILCGAKLWEWSPGPRGRMWDKILTDTDGPYAELMVGAFSDNQPDYSWIKPYEVKTFKQCWYPIRNIGGFKNANRNAAVNLQLDKKGAAKLGFCATAQYPDARVLLKAGDKTLLERTIDIGPDKPFTCEVTVPSGVKQTDLKASLLSSSNQMLISYQPVKRTYDPNLPAVVKAPPAPKDIPIIEQLYLTGLRIEQIHNPRVNPDDYFEEALRRDPGDSRTNTIVGVNYIKRAMFKQAEQKLRKAIARISAEYTRPENAGAYYYLGLALRGQGKGDKAYDAFYRATWDSAFHSAAYYQLAELSCRKKDYKSALAQINRSLATNAVNTKAMNIKAAILRKLDRPQEAEQTVSKVIATDPLDFLARNELYLAQLASGSKGRAEKSLTELTVKMRGNVQSYLELAADYGDCGLWDEAIDVLSRPVKDRMAFADTYPMVHYYLGYLYQQKDDESKASRCFSRAAKMPVDYCFPFRAESIKVLNAAIRHNPSDARAHYYLGDLLYDLQPQAAIRQWEKCRQIDDSFALVHRNLGWAYYRTEKNVPKAIASYEKAVACNSKDPRLYAELDNLYEAGNAPIEKRLALLENNHEIVKRRNDSFQREIMVLVLAGRYDKAVDYLTNNQFHIREGGGEIHDVYVDAHLLRGLRYLRQGKPKDALTDFQAASEYPDNLSVGRPGNDSRAAQVAYYTASAYEALGDSQKAGEFYRKAADQKGTGGWPEARFYQGLSLVKLGQKSRADEIFDDLVKTGKQRLSGMATEDFFAKFGGGQTAAARQASAHYILGLGYRGKGQNDQAKAEFEKAVQLNVSDVWAAAQLAE